MKYILKQKKKFEVNNGIVKIKMKFGENWSLMPWHLVWYTSDSKIDETSMTQKVKINKESR